MKIFRLIVILLAVQFWTVAQQLPIPLSSRVFNQITSATTVLDNRSTIYQKTEHTFIATGTGTWSATIQYADGTPTSWFNFTAGIPTVSNTSTDNVGLGRGYHDFIRFSITGSVVVNYNGTGNVYLPIGNGGGSTPTTPLCQQIPSIGEYNSSCFNFTSQAPGGSISTGSNTITLTPCPAGVNWNDTPSHYLYISGGAGTPEATPINPAGPGTCVSGAPTGTITLTAANSHSGAWRISSATCGIEEAIFSLPSTGGTITEPPEVCVLWGPIVKPPFTVYIQGAGPAATTWRIPAAANGDPVDFPLGVTGVYQIPDDSSLYNTRLQLSGGITGINFSFYQPQTATSVAALTHWPAAIYGNNTNRPYFSNLMWTLAWDGINILGTGDGFYLVDTKSSAFHRAVQVDGQVDSSRVRGFHSWPFATTNNNLLNTFLYDPNVYAFWIGQADDLKIEGCATDSANSADIHLGAGGIFATPWVSFTDCDLDTGRVNISAGKTFIDNSVINAYVDPAFNGVTTTNAITMSGGELFVSNSTVGASAPFTGYILNLDYSNSGVVDEQALAGAVFTNCRFYTIQDSDMLYVHSGTTRTGLLTVTGSHFIIPGAQSINWNSNMIHAVGPVKVIATGNDVTSKVDHTGTWFNADTDYGHIVTGNSATGWSIGYPAALRVSTFANNSIVNPTPISSSVAITVAGELDPSGPIFHVTNASPAISTIIWNNLRFPYGNNVNTGLYQFTVIPDAAFTTVTSFNIAIASTAVIGKALTFTYDPTTSKWYPSY